MSSSKANEKAEALKSSPQLAVDERGNPDLQSLADVIQWFLDYDQRVAVIRHPKVEELFHWKQEESKSAGERVFEFNRAEDRLAIGIMQALALNASETELHAWISQLLNALDDASKTNEEMASAYRLEMNAVPSIVAEAAKIPTERERVIFLSCCWLETLCTSELRVLGWVYQELYGKPFAPR